MTATIAFNYVESSSGNDCGRVSKKLRKSKNRYNYAYVTYQFSRALTRDRINVRNVKTQPPAGFSGRICWRTHMQSAYIYIEQKKKSRTEKKRPV